MNRIIKCLFLLLITFGFITIVNAESKDVKAKYNEYNKTVYYSSFMNNYNAYFNLNNLNLTVSSDNYSDNGMVVMVIPVYSNALDWIKSNAVGNDIVSYYIFFKKDNNNYNPIGNITAKLSISNVYSNAFVQSIDLSGNVIDKSSEIINSSISVKINQKNYIVLSNYDGVIKHTLNISCGLNGNVVIDKKIYKGKFNYKIDDNSDISLIIKPDANYIVKKILLNNVDITNQLEAGFVNIKAITNDKNIDITFEKTEENKTLKKYTLSGSIIMDGQPINNAIVELHSKVLTTITDKNGFFVFNDVPDGNHTLTVIKNNEIIGYTEFKINTSNNNKLSKNNGITNISLSRKIAKINLKLDLDNNGKIIINSFEAMDINDKIISIDSFNYNYYIWYIGVSAIIILIIIIIIKLKKKN